MARTASQIADRMLTIAGERWSLEVGHEQIVIRPVRWSHPRFAPNISVLPVEGPPALYSATTSVQLVGSLDSPFPLHQVVVDVYDGVPVTHETVWLAADSPGFLAVTSSAAGADVDEVADIMAGWQQTLEGRDDA